MQATPITAELVRGALELEPTERGLLLHRLPARARVDGELAAQSTQPAGDLLLDHAEHPLPDDLHPDAETHALIGARFAERLSGYSASSEASTSSGTS